jgi:biopolymer transport protein ExbD
MKSRLFGKHKKKRAELPMDSSLNITSMADVFTILLVFLLKSYSTGAAAVTPAPGMTLPISPAGSTPVEALKLQVSVDSVTVEGNPVLKLAQFRMPASEKLQNGASKSLSTAIEKERKRQLLIAQANPEVKVDAKVIVVADQKTPYDTLKTVLASAAAHGYTDFKLAVIQNE